jgi:hypothetical protein
MQLFRYQAAINHGAAVEIRAAYAIAYVVTAGCEQSTRS